MKVLAHVVAVVVLGLLAIQVVGGIVNGSPIIQDIPFILFLVAALAVGWLLAWKQPRNPLGWILMAVTGLFTVGTGVYLATTILPLPPVVSTWLFVLFGAPGVEGWSWLPPVWLLLSQLPLRFPTGRLPSPRWRGFHWFSIGALAIASTFLAITIAEAAPGISNPIYVEGAESQPAFVLLTFGCLAVAFVGSIASLFVRYSGATSVERTQIRWVLWALAVAVGLLILSWILAALGAAFDYSWLFAGGYGLIPIAIGVSVMRFRLYDIDRIISRTASYALVSLVVIGVYLLVVTSVHWLLPDLPAIGVALATLAAAALFLPVLRWVRRVVDRRFDRERYDAEKVVDAFGEHLRTDLDPHSTTGELVEAIEKTLQPASVGIWTAGGTR
jgi:hypothetical protein